MVATLLGNLMVHAQKRVEVGSKLQAGLAPIHHQHTVERTAVDWGQVLEAENVTIRTAQVRSSMLSSDLNRN